MFGVEHHLAHACLRVGDALRDHVQVLGIADAERDIDVEVPRLAHHADRLNLGIQERVEAGIVGGAAARPAGHAEGDQLRPLQGRRLGKKGVVGRIGTRPATLDIVDAEPVQRLGNGRLVVRAEIDALGLGAIAQSAVE
jgi:hypothetical protein